MADASVQSPDFREHLMLPGLQPETAESEASWRACRKNPGHPTFIPYPEFGPQHLPEDLRTSEVLEYINLTAALTVRLRVAGLSSQRPVEGFFAATGTCVGSGFIVREDITGAPPPEVLDADLDPTLQGETLYRFEVHTAKHVVYDDAEAKRTTAELYFDDACSRADGKIKELHGVKLSPRLTSDHTDNCVLVCVSSDSALVAQVKQHRDRWIALYNGLFKNCLGFKSDRFVVVSHPHGQAKHVTVGEMATWGSITVDELELGNSFWYTASTCPGSSGAPVMGVGKYGTAYNIHSRRGKTHGSNVGNIGTHDLSKNIENA